MKMAAGRILLGVVLAVWAVVFFILALYFDEPLNAFDSGPDSFPLLISGSLFITSLVLIVQELRALPKSAPIKANRFRQNLGSAAVIIAYALAMPYAGYYLDTLFFIPALLLSSGERRWKWITALTAFLLVFNYLAFDRLLGVSLPRLGAAFIK
jgi:putative tricarboxylic transport membrane protein